MYIVGTAGHIDHGKTSLIKALTGIDCDRLPEEKEREMTIDIGFARIEYPKFGTVSIIDVPGHERFIRNMVAGAWGMDLALLVVAVDDGWMPQTEDHFRVLSLLGVERMVAVLNKIDLADAEMIAFVEEEVREKVRASRFSGADLARVSSRTGGGIPELRELILKNLKMLAKAADSRKPYLFVDRVFAAKGYGTVVTGTLKNGSFHDDDSVVVLPEGREVRIKKIESHNREIPEGVPSQRTALNLAGISSDEIHRGHIVVRNNFFTDSPEFIARIELLDRVREIKNNTGVEVLIGTESLKAKLIFINNAPEGRNPFNARIKPEKPWHCFPGQHFVLTRPGGYRVMGGGTVVLPDYRSLPSRRAAHLFLPLICTGNAEELLLYTVSAHGFIPEKRLESMFPQSAKVLEKMIVSLIDTEKLLRKGEYIVEGRYYKETAEKIAEAVKGTIGLKLREIADKAGINADFCREIMAYVAEEYGMVEKDGKYFTGSAVTPETLPHAMKSALAGIERNGIEGIELERVSDEAFKKLIKDLVKLDLAVSLDGNIILHRSVYEDLKEKIMALFAKLERITVPDAKDATSLSRKYIIPLLNRIEGDGLIKRIGDFRIKA